MTPEAAEAVERDREHLETLADSDLPCDWVAAALLESAEVAEEVA